MVKRLITDLDTRLVEASKSILLEIMTILGAYRSSLVLVGGWAPYFIIESFKSSDDDFIHAGSLDIDIAVNPKKISEVEYKSILKLIEERNYTHSFDKEGRAIPYAFEKNISIPGYKDKQPIEIDFLGPEYGGRGKRRRHQIVQSELFIRKARGIDIVFEHSFMYRLKGKLPKGACNEIEIQIADLVSALTMKGIVLGARYSEKDAYDIYSLISHYKDGFSSAAETIKPYQKDKLVNEGIESIRQKFKTKDSIGPQWVADFLVSGREFSSEERQRLVTDSYMQVNEFLILLSK
ncbi:hypothetical protein KKC91_07460 [bacterium]|nr:hypothetical protein [bacterium]